LRLRFVQFAELNSGMPLRCTKQIQEICRRFPIQRLPLFGSRARGKAKPRSDHDFQVDFSGDAEPTLIDLGDLHSDPTSTLQASVDLITNQPSLPTGFLRDAKTIFQRK
jgi:predicted nucleotidyltransferase